jgi:hypothetical protein
MVVEIKVSKVVDKNKKQNQKLYFFRFAFYFCDRLSRAVS